MYLNLFQIAESLGVSERTIQEWILSEALPCTSDRGRLLFDRAQVATWAAGRGLAAHVGFLAADSAPSGLRLEELLRRGRIWRNVASTALPGIYYQVLSELPGAVPAIRRLIQQRLEAKSGITFAPIGEGFALPHLSGRLALGEGGGIVALIFLKEPVQLREPRVDDDPVFRLAFFNAPTPRTHLDLLGRLSRALRSGPMREAVLRAAPDSELLAAAAAEDQAAGKSGREDAL